MAKKPYSGHLRSAEWSEAVSNILFGFEVAAGSAVNQSFLVNRGINEMLLEKVKEVIISSVGNELTIDMIDENFQLIGNILDSMAVTNLILALEEYFGFMFDDDDLSAEAFETVGSLAQLVERKLSS